MGNFGSRLVLDRHRPQEIGCLAGLAATRRASSLVSRLVLLRLAPHILEFTIGEGPPSRVADDDAASQQFSCRRLPSMWCVSTQPLYGTLMPQSGRRPLHQKRRFEPKSGISASPPKPEVGSPICQLVDDGEQPME